MAVNFFGGAVSAFVASGIIAAAAALGACGSSAADSPSTTGARDGGGDDDGATPTYDSSTLTFTTSDASAFTLAFDPPQAALTVDGVTPKNVSFSLKATYASGATTTVQPDALEFDRPDLAALKAGSPVTLTASGQAAGSGTLHGIYQGIEATAKLTITVAAVTTGAGVTPGQVATLNGATAADPGVTSLLYPYDKTLFPLGLTAPLVMWSAPNASDVYRVHLAEKSYTYDAYYVVAQPAQQAIDQTAWDRVTASNQGDPLMITLSRLDVASGSAYVSASQSWTIVPASLRGAIYYWTTSGTGHMSRIQPGQGAAPAQLNGGVCMGCHAVSADGTTLVAVVESAPSTYAAYPSQDGSERAWVNFSLPAATQSVASSSFGGNVAVNPDGKLVVFGDRKLDLGDTTTGATIASSGLDTILAAEQAKDSTVLGFMTPAFSPDGTKLAMVEGGQGAGKSGAWYHDLYDGHLVVTDVSESAKTVSNLKQLAPASFFPPFTHAGGAAIVEQGVAYPSFAPDSKSIAFHVGDYTTGCDVQGCDANATQNGAIWMQDTGGANPVRLTTLSDSSPNDADHDVSFEPTFNPVERGGYFWVVFTSSRDWGNRIAGTPNNGKKRLWVAAIDKTWTGAVDPSHPAFFLQGQEEDTTNMRGFWSLAQCTPTPGPGAGGGTCAAGFECCSGFCDQGQCVDVGTVACQGTDGACTADTDCCNSSVVKCVHGACTPQQVK